MSNISKKAARLRRATKLRERIKKLLFKKQLVRLSIIKSSKHISAQLIDIEPVSGQSKVLACVSTQQKAIKALCTYTGNIEAAKIVGQHIAEVAKKMSLSSIVFDRAGHKYHGRIKALADSARESGLDSF